MESDKNGVFHIGHASNLVRINKRLILFDPCWKYQPFSEYWSLLPEQYDCQSILDKIDACVVSHIHDDHYSAEIMAKLNCKVHIMGKRQDLTKKLKSFGCDVIEHKALKHSNILPFIDIYFIPHAFNPVDSSCFVAGIDYCFYHGNDNFVRMDYIEEAVRIMTKPNVATIPYAYLNWYPENLLNLNENEKKQETKRLIKKLADAAVDLIKSLDPLVAIPAGANLYYIDELNSPFNEMGINPWEFQRMCEPEIARKILCATAGDYIIGNNAYLHRHENQFNEEVRDSLKKNKPKNKTAKVVFGDKELDLLKSKAKKAKLRIPHHTVVFKITDGLYTHINLETGLVHVKESDECKTPNHVIYIEPYQLNEWLAGRMTYEMVVATRKFKMLRRPNDYNVKVFEFILNYL